MRVRAGALGALSVLSVLFLAFAFTVPLAGQELPAPESLVAGPMLGPVVPREAILWLQTGRAASVQVRYAPAGSVSPARLTPPVTTSESEDFALTLRLGELQPGTDYEYEVYVDGEAVVKPWPFRFHTGPFWRWREPAPDVTLLLGSCAYINDPPFDRPGTPYGGGLEIFDTMAAQKADAMLWLGDTVYLRDQEVDSPSAIRYRYRFSRAAPELQRFLGATSHYAIWDDHDFGPDDADGSYPLKHVTTELFKRYWPAIHHGLPDVPGVFQTFVVSDVRVFLLDDRTYRVPDSTPDGPSKTFLGKGQKDWFKEALLSSTETFKLVAIGTQAFSERNQRNESLRLYASELKELLDWIRDRKIEGVVLLTGDRHHTELAKRTLPGLYPLYEYTSSPLTSGVRGTKPGDAEETNPERVAGTYLLERNFGKLRVEGPRGNRRLVFEAYDTKGTLKWSKAVDRSELSFPKEPKPTEPKPAN